jgi:hypothetical protein
MILASGRQNQPQFAIKCDLSQNMFIQRLNLKVNATA